MKISLQIDNWRIQREREFASYGLQRNSNVSTPFSFGVGECVCVCVFSAGLLWRGIISETTIWIKQHHMLQDNTRFLLICLQALMLPSFIITPYLSTSPAAILSYTGYSLSPSHFNSLVISPAPTSPD